MNLVLIRTCQRDDALAYRAYQSFKAAGIEGKYIFFAEYGEYELITQTNETIIYHPHYSNYGGRDNVLPYLTELKKMPYKDYRYIFLSDADIVVHKNPLEHTFDFGGIPQAENHRHLSGQLLIFSQWLFERVIKYDKYWELMEEFLSRDYCIADDTVLSWIATEQTTNIHHFVPYDYWTHTKD